MVPKRVRLDVSAKPILPGSLSGLLHEIASTPHQPAAPPAEKALRPGMVISGRFSIVKEIGRGGLGVVYEALDERLGRPVAFKVVGARGDRSATLEERLQREGEAAARLAHPNIVTLLDRGLSACGPYLVLELLHGRTLGDRLKHGRLPLRESLRIGVEVARGLAHAHGQGIVHRDLKPANVFLCQDGCVKLLDFGLAHALGRPRVEGGTPAFMAPEQWRGAPEDERTDVFALGVVLYRMLTGELPFGECADGKALLSDRAAPSLDVPGAPALGALVGRMLEKDPVRRPRHGAEVLEALSAFLSELDRASSPSESAAPRAKRRRAPGASASIPKLCQPRPRRVYERTRLFRRLDEGRDRPAVWIAGQPGAGKTTLAASWLARRRLRALWYDVDAGDDDVASFFYYLGIAARAGRERDGLPLFAPEYRGGLPVFSRRFFREFVARVAPPFVLVLDDVQEVPRESRFHEAVREGIEEMPRGATMMFLSRTEPPPAYARFCAYGAMSVVTADDLKLSASDARGIARVRRSPLTGARAAELAARADGWAAGLVLLLERAG
ncbi:MAG TPA: protein kinase, partial [Anaeromyxobacter sp.]